MTKCLACLRADVTADSWPHSRSVSKVDVSEMRRPVNANACFLRTHKTDKPLFTWLPHGLVDRMETLSKARGPRPFLKRQYGPAPIKWLGG
jgi:hypothetical protein